MVFFFLKWFSQNSQAERGPFSGLPAHLGILRAELTRRLPPPSPILWSNLLTPFFHVHICRPQEPILFIVVLFIKGGEKSSGLGGQEARV